MNFSEQRVSGRQELENMGVACYASQITIANKIPTPISKIRRKQSEFTKFHLGDAEAPLFLVAGRITAIREMGKSVLFMDVRDFSNDPGDDKIQIYIKKNMVAADNFAVSKKFDIGDIAAFHGQVFTTKSGELSICAKSIQLLTKNMRELPEKWHGLSDPETRYRQRYADMIANESVRKTFADRSRIIHLLRQRLTNDNFMEVETPMMHSIVGGAKARPFETHHNALDMDLFMRIAPELYLKRLLVGGFNAVFEINRSFRNEGISTKHNPEFTMLELYWAYSSLENMMDLTESIIFELVSNVCRDTGLEVKDSSGNAVKLDFSEPFQTLSYGMAFAEANGFDRTDEAAVMDKAQSLGIKTEGMDLVFIANEIFEKTVEPSLIEPTFIVNYPSALCPLAKKLYNNPELCERFELFINGMEIANAYSELNDPVEQYERFKEQIEHGVATGDSEIAKEIDEDYINALAMGMPPATGMGIGIDRLVMLLTGNDSIRDVIMFPLMKKKHHDQ